MCILRYCTTLQLTLKNLFGSLALYDIDLPRADTKKNYFFNAHNSQFKTSTTFQKMTIQETIESTEQTNEPGNPQSIDENIVDKPPLAKLESLVTALTERIALLEDKQDEAIRDVPLREQSVRFANEVNANDGRRVSISGSKKFSEIENGVGCGLKDDELSERLDLIERRIEDFEDIKSDCDGDDEKYKLPESTFSLFITHHPLSVPFAFAVFTTALSTCCLGLTLAESVSNGTQGNVLGIPGGVSDAVRAAQFFGAIVGKKYTFIFIYH